MSDLEDKIAKMQELKGLAKNTRFVFIVFIKIFFADSRGTTVITVGVETITELNFLCENSRSTLQGYYFSRPLPPADFQDRHKSCILALKAPDCDNTSTMETTP